jgi:hypothetical protein
MMMMKIMMLRTLIVKEIKLQILYIYEASEHTHKIYFRFFLIRNSNQLTKKREIEEKSSSLLQLFDHFLRFYKNY